jgi:hypothetical protein
MAYDLFSIPAMNAKTERVFSNTKLMISPNKPASVRTLLKPKSAFRRGIRQVSEMGAGAAEGNPAPSRAIRRHRGQSGAVEDNSAAAARAIRRRRG